jgi:hypothetical protein
LTDINHTTENNVGQGSSALEALINAVVGLLVSWAATFTLLPLWGLTPSAGQSLGITGMFFVLSFARAFLIREAFRKWAS